MKKTDEGYSVTNEEIQKATKILGYVGLAMLATRLFRLLFSPTGGQNKTLKSRVASIASPT